MEIEPALASHNTPAAMMQPVHCTSPAVKSKLLPAGPTSKTLSFFFFNDTATTEIYTLSHTTLFRSQSPPRAPDVGPLLRGRTCRRGARAAPCAAGARSRAQARRARERHDRAGHAVRRVRVQLHRADRRPRSRFADPHAAEHQGT